MSRLRSMSLNIPSSLLVNWLPHSAFSLEIMFFSASVLDDFPSSRRFARSFLKKASKTSFPCRQSAVADR